jgi:hypothetical protein
MESGEVIAVALMISTAPSPKRGSSPRPKSDANGGVGDDVSALDQNESAALESLTLKLRCRLFREFITWGGKVPILEDSKGDLGRRNSSFGIGQNAGRKKDDCILQEQEPEQEQDGRSKDVKIP